jgi:hypothetical protein
MKSITTRRCRFSPRSLLVGLALLAAGWASAQNFVKNPDFEEELGPDNWTIVYAPVTDSGVNGNGSLASRMDFLVAGRTTMAHKDLYKPYSGVWDGDPTYWSKFGGHFAPNHSWVMHAYFKQVVTNLAPLGKYRVSAWMTQFGAHMEAAQVYMEVLGGVAGNISQKTPFVFDNSQNNPSGWKRYVIPTNTASSSGQLEIRLHYNKNKNVGDADHNYWEYRNQNAFYDHVAVVPVGQSEDATPYKIESLTLENQTPTIKFQTVSNNIYAMNYAGQLDPLIVTNIDVDPDTGITNITTTTNSPFANWAKPLFLVATGTNMTVTNNVRGSPRFFRIQQLWPYP